MLGGDVAQIQEQATAYQTLGQSLTTTGGNVVTTTDGAVAGLQDQITAAQGTVVAALQAVGDESRAVMSQFGGIAWTGANRAQVEAVATDLDTQIVHTTLQVQEIFDTFKAELTRLGGELTSVSMQFSAAAAAAGESAASISQAMTAQAAQLDEVMNTGITSA
jgi:hypothetical protein